MIEFHDRPDGVTRALHVLVLCVTGFLLLQLISIHLSWQNQAILGGATMLVGLLANRMSASRVVTLALMFISMSATFRYGWWRIQLLIDFFSDESNTRVGLDASFLLLLISAEMYTILIMVLGYMQTAWPLRRMPIPLPTDDREWPHVDLLIPTYNEPLSLVRYTALAALNIDYPPEKLHVYILDDGTRDDFDEFASEAGVGYIIRREHGHAKAGNINHALTTMDSPYVAIFDCDHVPTRSFLQVTLGWMLADSQLGMLQTPHHFYSPDPFERNLLQYKTIPNEAELFYGIVQDGNDFWNATFFCGSCALIRRAALDAVGGIATETVTEDAHTSLRMQRRGYNTAYINIPQAAGLATESLAAHVGQRIRWARGMIQILRTDNPLFGRGLKFTQRLCYFNAMIHFLYSVPRLVFLVAPLVYLLLGRTIIPGYWVAILAYAIPHLILASLTNSRIQGRHRHSFWNEIYESVLAPYILAPTLLALINPKLGKFNVTSKGNTLGQTQFDRKIATPTRWLLILNFCGLLTVPYRLFVTDPQHPGAVIMNMVWVLFNIVILGVAAAVALEQKQRRGSVRIEAKLPVCLTTAAGQQLSTISIDMSVGGASIKVPAKLLFRTGDILKVTFPATTGTDEISAQVIGLVGDTLRIAFQLNTIAEQEILTRALYSRADAWLESSNLKEVDRPLISLGRVMVLSTYGIYQVCRSLFPERSKPARAAHVKVASVILITMLAGFLAQGAPARAAQGSANGQARRSTSSNTSEFQNADALHPPPDANEDNLLVISLKDMSLPTGIEMRGPHSYSSSRFTLPHQLVPKEGVLKLAYSIDSSVDPQSAALTISLNGTALATLHPTASSDSVGGVVRASISIPSLLLVRKNTLTFEYTGSEVMEREEHARSHVLLRIAASTTIEVEGDWLRLGNDLSQLPLPFFDNELQTTTTIPFAFLTQPSPSMLEAAGAVASWFGVSTGPKPPRFSISENEIPTGNAVIFSADRSALPDSLQIPHGRGPVLALRSNPSDPIGSLLVLAGDSDSDVVSIARMLSMFRGAGSGSTRSGSSLAGDTIESPALNMPRQRLKDDAPRWLPVSKIAPLSSCSNEEALKTDGSSPIPVYFHTPPDLFYGEKQNVELHLKYRYDAHLVAPGSALRVTINGELAGDVALHPGAGVTTLNRTILIPADDLRPFGNTALFSFDFVPARHDTEPDSILSGEILCDSTLDLHGLGVWTRMPNLQLFVEAGFPFTQYADLSHTTVVLPNNPTPGEIAFYLQFASYFGELTGLAAVGVTVTGPNNVIGEGRDYLVIGTTADQPAFASLSQLLPATYEGNALHVKPPRGLSVSLSSIQDSAIHLWSSIVGNAPRSSPPPVDTAAPDAVIEEIESPASPDRTIVTIMLRADLAAGEVVDGLRDPLRSSNLNTSILVFQGTSMQPVASSSGHYSIGTISWYSLMRIYFARYYAGLLFIVLALGLLSARFASAWMAWHAQERLRLAASTREEDWPAQ